MKKSILLLIVLSMFFAGCKAVGPEAINAGRSDYNIAIQQTSNEQMLLNLVRLKYRDTPFFMEVASVSTNFNFKSTAGASATLPESASKSYGLSGSLAYTENPTITYTPLQGDKFVAQLMSPVDLDTILLLYHSGWSIERIFRVCIQSINGIKNMPSASGPTPDYEPVCQEFFEVIKLLRSLQKQGKLEMGKSTNGPNGQACVELRFTEEGAVSDEAAGLRELLGLDNGRRSFPMMTQVGKGNKDRLGVVTRSLMAGMFYLSQAVSVPVSDEQAGRVTVTKTKNGQRYNWQEAMGQLITIESSKKTPQNAYATVYYRGHWFYIDDSGLTSKSTFSLLMQLFALEAVEIKSTAPVLTLPVG